MKTEKCPTVREHGRASNGNVGDVAIPITTDDFSTRATELQQCIDGRVAPKRADAERLAGVYGEIHRRLLAPSYQRRAELVSQCGTFLEYQVSEQGSRLHRANFCRDRLCPLCTWRRSLKIYAQISQVMDVLQERGYVFLFLTLTIRNRPGADLPDAVQTLYSGWRQMYHENRVFRRTICGTFRSLEVTRNEQTGEYHPHLHCILAVRPSYFDGKNYLTKSAWRAMWRDCAGLDYEPQVDIQRIRPRAGADGSVSLAGAAAEVAKYATKSADYLHGSLDDMVACVSDYLIALAGRRLCAYTGVFGRVRRELALDDVEDGDLVRVDGTGIRPDLAYMIVRYHWRAGVYVREIADPGK